MGGGPVLEELYVPYQRPHGRRFDDVPFYAPASRSDYYDRSVQSVLTGIIAALQEWQSCAVDRNRDGDGDRARTTRNRSAVREDAVKPDEGTAATEAVLSDNSVDLPVNESAGSQAGQTSSSVEAATLSPEVTTSPSVRSDVAGESVDIDSEHGGEVLVDDLRPKGQSAEVEMEGGTDEERRAATLVQARFRGYMVRKTRPLVQLRAIARIEAKLKKLTEEAKDAAFLEEVGKEQSKARLGFDEGTLALLIQLDDIQGSHPVVRQIRKSVVREIVALQENVDALAQRSGTSRM